jgi:hypothetical protein
LRVQHCPECSLFLVPDLTERSLQDARLRRR